MNCGTLAMAILTAASCCAGDKVTVCLSPGDNAEVIRRAESMASQMFLQAGVDLDWRGGLRECRSPERQAIVIGLLETRPSDAAPLSMARAFVFEGVHIEIFEPQVSGRDGIDPVLLAHVMVHEITHILQGVPRHSETGVMKACWNHNDFALMHYQPLRFAPEDVELIHLGMMKRRSNLGVGAVSNLAGQPGPGQLPVAQNALGR